MAAATVARSRTVKAAVVAVKTLDGTELMCLNDARGDSSEYKASAVCKMLERQSVF